MDMKSTPTKYYTFQQIMLDNIIENASFRPFPNKLIKF